MPRKRTRNPKTRDPYEQMVQFARLREEKVVIPEIARREDRSVKHVQNLLRASDRLPLDLKERLKRKELTLRQALHLAPYGHAFQRRLNASGQDRPHQVTLEFLKALREACRASSMSPEWKAGALSVLTCALGEAAIQGVWPCSPKSN